VNPASYVGSRETTFPKPDEAPLIGEFSYLRMALKASYGLEAMHLSSCCLEYLTSTDGSRATSCKWTIEIIGQAAAG
jgi:hypothetical protein